MPDPGFLDPFKKAIVEIARKQLVRALVIRAPFLSFGPINWALVWFLDWVIGRLLAETILGINLIVVDIENDGDVRKMKTIIEEIKKLKPEEKERRDNLETEFIEAASDLIRLRDERRL